MSAIFRQHQNAAERQDLAVIPPNVLAHMLRYAETHGVDCWRWLAGLGVSRAQLHDPNARLSYHQVRTIVLRALASFDDPGLGLALGRSESASVFGLLGVLMRSARTLGEAMRMGIENHEVSGSLLDMGLESLPDGAVALMLWPRFDDPDLEPFLCEEMIASSLVAVREIAGPTFRLSRVELAYPAPSYASRYADALETRVSFAAAANRIVVDARWMDVPLPGHDPLMARQMLEICRTQRRSAGHEAEQEIVVAVERLIRHRLPQRPRIGSVARSLNLSERSLRRRLADSGASYRAILDQVRAERARQLLRDASNSMMEVAGAVGFSDAREFRRAFKRWTGMTPQAARNGLGAYSAPGLAASRAGRAVGRTQ